MRCLQKFRIKQAQCKCVCKNKYLYTSCLILCEMIFSIRLRKFKL